ncbi:hypothetical protein ACFVTY_21940 [Streptomyces sp. NPDC058067]|uniref:hypothetical protein n=1 Tax=Streptomyces sp. NPDC058067 TaxID=3346324 RepID=UPI0036F03BBA
MMIHGHDATTARRPRLLPWSSLDGNPCYLVSDDTGDSYLSRVADNVEYVQLGMAEDLLSHAADLLGDGERKATAPQLHFLASRLAESLRDVHRIARSRGARLHVSDGNDDESSDFTPAARPDS